MVIDGAFVLRILVFLFEGKYFQRYFSIHKSLNHAYYLTISNKRDATILNKYVRILCIVGCKTRIVNTIVPETMVLDSTIQITEVSLSLWSKV